MENPKIIKSRRKENHGQRQGRQKRKQEEACQNGKGKEGSQTAEEGRMRPDRSDTFFCYSRENGKSKINVHNPVLTTIYMRSGFRPAPE
jgi:hypothetical protein